MKFLSKQAGFFQHIPSVNEQGTLKKVLQKGMLQHSFGGAVILISLHHFIAPSSKYLSFQVQNLG